MDTRPRSILLIAFHFPPEPVAGSARPFRFFRYLPEYGYCPQVITAAVQTAACENIHQVAAPTYFPDKYTMEGAIEILLHKAALPTELALLWAGPASRIASALIRGGPVPAAIISTAPPLNTHLAALKLKRKWGIPWIADFRDPITGSPFRRYGKIPEMVDRALESLIFRHADILLTVTDAIAEDWRAQYPKYADKIRVLWNGFDPAESAGLVARNSGKHKTLAYIGSLYGNRHPDSLLQSVQRLLDRGLFNPESYRIKFVGEVGRDVKAPSVSIMSALQSGNVLELAGHVSRTEALNHMASADILILLDITGKNRGFAVPAKLYEYIRTGRPVLAVTQRDSPVQRILERSGIRYRCIHDDESEGEIDSKVLELLTESSEPSTPSEWFLNTFDGRRQTQALAAIIDSLDRRS